MIILNQARVKRLALDIARRQRTHKFTRVSQEFIQRIDASLKVLIVREINALPSKGRTIK